MVSTAIHVDLGDMADHARQHLASGEYESMDEVMRHAVQALDRERAAFEDMLRRKVQEALDDPAPPLAYDDGMAEVWHEIRRRRTG